MFTNHLKYPFFAILMALLGCSGTETSQSDQSSHTDSTLLSFLTDRFNSGFTINPDPQKIPRSYENEALKLVAPKDWTSGFFPGNLWMAYDITENEKFRDLAIEWTAIVDSQKYNTGIHDVGFMIYCSAGKALEYTDSAYYEEVIMDAANSLISRYNENVKAIRSWDFGDWQYPVIIDNMMNLELLFAATRLSGDSIYYEIARNHAITTMNNHFREDMSSYHVLDYDTITGEVRSKGTFQGVADSSVWARGQAWGLYGYTMCYRETGYEPFVNQAIEIAEFWMTHPQLPDDLVPYWDFDEADDPEVSLDASAAAIVASALYELAELADAPKYKEFADRTMLSLSSENYLLPDESKLPFLLDHSTGHRPHDSEIDVPIVYADYYYLEALLRSDLLKKN